MIRHEAVRDDTHPVLKPVLLDKPQAISVVVGTEEDLTFVRTTIEDMVVFVVFVLHCAYELVTG
jgi:hypothetical protein